MLPAASSHAISLPTRPRASVLAILNGDAMCRENVTDFVGGAPVLVRFRRGAHVDDQVEQGSGFAGVTF